MAMLNNQMVKQVLGGDEHPFVDGFVDGEPQGPHGEKPIPMWPLSI